MALVTVTNLLVYGDFEGAGWTGASAWATDHVRFGSYSARVDASAASAEVCIYHSGGAPLVQGHTYYARWYVYHEGAQGSTGMYFPEAEPAFSEGHPLGPSGQWQMVSGRNVRSNWASASAATVRLDYNNSRTAGTVWIDGAMLIDLTEAFGAGAEPSQSWCDANIPFFIGTTEVDAAPIQGQVLSVSIQPNPASVGQTLLATVTARSVSSRVYILPADAWSGIGPYEMTLAVGSDITPDTECIVYGDHAMTLLQRVSEYNALIRAEILSAGRVRFTALSIRPTEDIRVRIITGMFPLMASVAVPASAWQGSGPWTASVDVGRSIGSAVVGAVSGSTDAQAEGLTDAGIHVSAVSGSTVTLRAILSKPVIDLVVGVMGI